MLAEDVFNRFTEKTCFFYGLCYNDRCKSIRRCGMAYKISDDCIMCGACENECPVSAISAGDDKYVIDPETCVECGACAGVCPVEAPKAE